MAENRIVFTLFVIGLVLFLAGIVGGLFFPNETQKDFACVTITGTVTGIQKIDGENHVTLDSLVGFVVILPGDVTPEIGKEYSFNYYKGAELYMSYVGISLGIRVLARVELEEIR